MERFFVRPFQRYTDFELENEMYMDKLRQFFNLVRK
jgi:hypothetical protein